MYWFAVVSGAVSHAIKPITFVSNITPTKINPQAVYKPNTGTPSLLHMTQAKRIKIDKPIASAPKITSH